MAPTGARSRHVPQRTCIGCREEGERWGFVRIVRTPEQRVVIDPGGKANGRGAYLHRTFECWEKALKGGSISHALRISPAKEDVEALRAFGAGLATAAESDNE
jgi:uncharacterized protein